MPKVEKNVLISVGGVIDGANGVNSITVPLFIPFIPDEIVLRNFSLLSDNNVVDSVYKVRSSLFNNQTIYSFAGENGIVNNINEHTNIPYTYTAQSNITGSYTFEFVDATDGFPANLNASVNMIFDFIKYSTWKQIY
jgi:hypothetical protein